MKILCLISILLAVLPVAGQISDKTVVDEFGILQCDDFLARIDHFLLQIHSIPDSHGYYVVSGSEANVGERLIEEQKLRSAFQSRRYDPDAVSIVRTERGGPIAMQLWIAPKGIIYPEFSAVGKNRSSPQINRCY